MLAGLLVVGVSICQANVSGLVHNVTVRLLAMDSVLSKQAFPGSVRCVITLSHLTHQALRESGQLLDQSESELAAVLLERALRRMSR